MELLVWEFRPVPIPLPPWGWVLSHPPWATHVPNQPQFSVMSPNITWVGK